MNKTKQTIQIYYLIRIWIIKKYFDNDDDDF